MNITTVCTSCRQPKLLCEFMGFGAKGTTKQYRTCNSCRTRNSQQKKNKRSYEKDENTDPLEVVEAAGFFVYIKQLLNIYTIQTKNDENILPFHLECKVDISALSDSAKEVADFLVKSIEDTDKFSWIYVYFKQKI